MGKEFILITGATGFISGRVLQLLLQQNYQVRIVVRSDDKKQSLLDNINFAGIEKSEFAVVPDLLAPDALDTAAVGADYILYLASPNRFSDKFHQSVNMMS
jgi:uncharacterized protein YbjT (DUF2867 family)